jgi:hypothetical protein
MWPVLILPFEYQRLPYRSQYGRYALDQHFRRHPQFYLTKLTRATHIIKNDSLCFIFPEQNENMSAFSAALLNPGFYVNSSPTKSPTRTPHKSPTKSPTKIYDSSLQSGQSFFSKARSATNFPSTLASLTPPNPPLGGSEPVYSDEERIWISCVEGWKWQTWGYDSKLKEWRVWIPKKAIEKMGIQSLADGKWVRFAGVNSS